MHVRKNEVWVREGTTEVTPKGKAASVRTTGTGRIVLRSSATMVTPVGKSYASFWEILHEWGGEWMWEHVSDKVKAEDCSWLVEGLSKGTLVWCADGSYKRKTDPDVAGVGWVVECRSCGRRLEGFFYEVSDDANAYRAEQLGMCGVHRLVAAVVLFSSLMEWKTKLGCDN